MLLTHLDKLEVNISLNIYYYDRNIYDIQKKSSFPHPLYDTMYYCMLQDLC